VSLKVSDTFLMANTGGVHNPAGAHLMVCLGIDPEKDTALIVPIVTRRDNSDLSCVLNVGDHPFIKQESCAAYDFMQVISLSNINHEIVKGRIKLRPAVSTDILVRLQCGFVLSDETAPWIFAAFRGQALMAALKHRGHIN
jgi:hypothetical protein